MPWTVSQLSGEGRDRTYLTKEEAVRAIWMFLCQECREDCFSETNYDSMLSTSCGCELRFYDPDGDPL